ncbi:serine-threonine protein kinase 19-domain-containing protein [Mucor mucedo]|uniref:serine-threonine protein kinase 19-domain-containing protein n=1 Tax=Mucor mucedo TaxID=29922 RepID=UPI00221F97E3|nr:serine-threonine protein kinase 19-domain-containing protein [Mucor mucedo]KAI7888454.1 serine-threonine protein kinase 19-domain-containing protein [Mucor mucedo]
MINSTYAGKVKKPDVYGIRKRKAKQIQHHDDDDDDYDFPTTTTTTTTTTTMEDWNINSDTISAAEYLTGMKCSFGLCLSHQIYSILENHTTVDRELQEAIQAKTWRKFHIMGSLEDEYLLSKTDTYLSHVCEQRNDDPIVFGKQTAFFFHRFEKVIEKYISTSIKKEILRSEFEYNEKQVSFLVSRGFLLPHMNTPDLYWFSIPRQGKFMSNLSNGRTEILRIIKKRPTRDIMEKMLKQKKLVKTKFMMEFLMHDLIGSGRVEK